MGLFEAIKNLMSGAAEGSISDVVGGLADSQVVQDLQDQATTATGSLGSLAGTASEQLQTVVEEVEQHSGRQT